MDASELKARALKAREWDHAEGEMVITLRTPTLHEIRQVSHQHALRDFGDAAERAMLQYHLVARQAVVWQGVRLRDLVPGAADGATPVPCSAEHMALLQDAQPELAAVLGEKLLSRVQLRNAAIEEDAKNLQSTSPGAGPAACASSVSSVG